MAFVGASDNYSGAVINLLFYEVVKTINSCHLKLLCLETWESFYNFLAKILIFSLQKPLISELIDENFDLHIY